MPKCYKLNEDLMFYITGLTAAEVVLGFICDFYNYDGEYQDSYRMIDPITVDGGLTVSDVTLPEGKVRLTYRLTDIYNQAYWTEAIEH